MANATRSQLERAYSLIQQEKLDEAISILKPILAAEPNNADAWWLMANAVNEPPDAHNALKNVLRLDPRNTEASELLQTLESEFPYLAQPSSSGFGDTDSSFDDLFGSSTSGVPSTSSSPSFGDSSFDDLLSDPAFSSGPTQSSFPTASSSSSSNSSGFDDINIDDLFASTPSSSSSSGSSMSAPASGEKIDYPFGNFDDDDFNSTAFGSTSFDSAPVGNPNFSSFDSMSDDPFASHEPDFMSDVFADAPAEPVKGKAEAKPRKEKAPKQPKEAKPKSIQMPKEEVAEDPFAAERRANSRRNPFGVLVLLLLLIVLVSGGVLIAAIAGVFKPATPVVDIADDSQFGVATSDPAVAANAIAARFNKQNFKNTTGTTAASAAAGNAIQITYCNYAGPRLIRNIYTALDLLATGAAAARQSVAGVMLTVVDCANPSAILYRATAPIAAINAYVDGGMKDVETFHNSWIAG